MFLKRKISRDAALIVISGFIGGTVSVFLTELLKTPKSILAWELFIFGMIVALFAAYFLLNIVETKFTNL